MTLTLVLNPNSLWRRARAWKTGRSHLGSSWIWCICNRHQSWVRWHAKCMFNKNPIRFTHRLWCLCLLRAPTPWRHSISATWSCAGTHSTKCELKLQLQSIGSQWCWGQRHWCWGRSRSCRARWWSAARRGCCPPLSAVTSGGPRLPIFIVFFTGYLGEAQGCHH